MISKLQSWRLTAVASAMLLGLWTSGAQALSLGQISVKSTLGEPLSAEIDILDLNPDEAATLVTKVASPDAFKASGLDFNPAISGLRSSLQRRANGKPYLKLTGDKPVNDPYVDMILEANWNTGRIVRDYTMLFDPPNFRGAAPAASIPTPTLAQTSKAPQTGQVSKPASPPSVAARPSKPEPAAASKKEPVADGSQQVRVKPGETASHLAGAYKPANVSLDQMLVALLRSNPDAFINDNVNRLKAGSLVTVPTEAQASETTPAQATQLIVAQSQDFNAFRRGLASNAPDTTVTPAGRDVSGKVQAKVEDKKTPLIPADKLTLSKGNVANAEQVAQARSAKEAADRAAELAKNLQDLSKIAAASNAAPAPTLAPSSAPAPVASATAAPPASAATPAASAAASAPVAVTAALPGAPASKPPVAKPEPTPEPTFIDSLLENPLAPAGALGLVALLAGLGIYRAQQRKKQANNDSIFSDSKLQPESFFGGTGGRSVDTNDSRVTGGSSMMYSPSQLDAVDDVDPVAEADVYLAYGRDLQAEEILKDALRTNPERLAIHQKLLEIYAKRRDAKAYEGVATVAFNLTNGTGPDWERICEKGLSLDADNALYLPGGQPLSEFKTTLSATDLDQPTLTDPLAETDTAASAPAPTPTSAQALQGVDNLDLDLDLDFSLDEPQLTEHTGAGELGDQPEIPHELVAEMGTEPLTHEPLSADNLPAMSDDDGRTDAPSSPSPSTLAALDFDLGLEDPSEASRPAPLDTGTGALNKRESDDSSPMELDLGSLSLDFDSSAPADLPSLMQALEHAGVSPDAPNVADAATVPHVLEAPDNTATLPGGYSDVDGDPLETKLALADEFKAIGDEDGARALIEEVLTEATGEVRERAERALKKL